MPKTTDPLVLAFEALDKSPPIHGQPVLLAGPTASGKSALALEIAKQQNRVIINADALQVYDMWQLISARPSAEETAIVPHFLYGTVSRNLDWSVGHWLRAVTDLLDQHPDPIIVGGTGLYFRALTEGLVQIPPIPIQIRREGDTRLRRAGIDTLIGDLDLETRRMIDLANPARVQRAWEVLQATGQGLADWHKQTPAPLLPIDQTTALVLRPDVNWLNKRIDARFEAMIAQGAVEEVLSVLPCWDPHAPWAKAIGAPELIAHVKGHISLAEAIAAATLASRQYAKRQRTWFRTRMSEWRGLAC